MDERITAAYSDETLLADIAGSVFKYGFSIKTVDGVQRAVPIEEDIYWKLVSDHLGITGAALQLVEYCEVAAGNCENTCNPGKRCGIMQCRPDYCFCFCVQA